MNRRDFLKKSLEGIIIVGVPFISGCGKKPEKPELGSNQKVTNYHSVTEDDINYRIETDELMYRQGTQVNLLYKITNKSDEEKEFFIGSPPIEIIILGTPKEKKNFEKMWSHSWDKREESGFFRLLPDETKEINLSWPKLLKGIYRFSGVFKHPEGEKIVSIDVYMLSRTAYQ